MADKKRILVVDDEPDLVRYLTVLLENNGFEATGAFDGDEGFQKASRDHPDLVILDISMPKTSGIKMYRNMLESEATSKIPVIMLTGISRDFKRFMASQKVVIPPAACLDKPVDEQELVTKIREFTA
jgi:DNA-binding response OmpR family regulator